MSIRLADISRWPIPAMQSLTAREKVNIFSPVSHTWELMPIHLKWLKDCTVKYGFDDIDETLRHLIYVSNSEPAKHKHLIFRIKRCLHCHVGARAGQHAKVSLTASVHRFQLQWLQTVTEKCNIASIEKCVRIICDFYQSRVKEAALSGEEAGFQKETEIFGMRRSKDARLEKALSKWNKKYEQEKAEEKKYWQLQQGLTPDLKELADDPAACTEEDSLAAISRCQVGRSSASYATARGETAEETATRRAKERLIEESDEAREKREFIRKVLYM